MTIFLLFQDVILCSCKQNEIKKPPVGFITLLEALFSKYCLILPYCLRKVDFTRTTRMVAG